MQVLAKQMEKDEERHFKKAPWPSLGKDGEGGQRLGSIVYMYFRK
jgi:hypothetical protein